MIKPRKSRLFDLIFFPYCRNLLRRNFSSIKLHSTVAEVLEKDSQSLLICANHSSWWDGLIAYFLSRHCGLDAFVMMEEKHLKRFFMFKYLGAFSVVRENPVKAGKSLRFAVDLLNDGGRAVWMFPQGEILPNDIRPITVYPGLEAIGKRASNTETAVLTFRYEYLEEPKAEVFVRAEKMAPGSYEQVPGMIESGLDQMRDEILEQDFSDYREILRKA